MPVLVSSMSYTYNKDKPTELPHAYYARSCKLANFTALSVTKQFKISSQYFEFCSFRAKDKNQLFSIGLELALSIVEIFSGKMLAVFEKSIGKPPAELNLPSTGSKKSKSRQEIAEIFQILWPETILCNISNGNFMGLSHENERPLHPRSIVVMDDIFCMFLGTLENICELKRHYGLSRQATEAMVLIEAYKVLRDRAPYPPDQVVKDLQGKFAFILFDAKSHTLFAARDCDGGVDLNWGIAGDGSLICSNDSNIMKEACGISCAPFPPGCMFMNGTGLMSFVHPLHKVRAIVHEDDDRQICGVSFQVDLYTRLPSIPRSGSAANWADATAVEAE